MQKIAKAQQGQGMSAMSDSSVNQPIQSISSGHPPGLPENPPPGLYGVVPPNQQRPHQSDGVQMGNPPPDNLWAPIAAWKAELKSTIHQGQGSTLKQKEKALAEQRRLTQELTDAKKQLAIQTAEAKKTIDQQRAKEEGKHLALEAEINLLRQLPQRHKLLPASSLPACDASNPWIEGTRVGITEDVYYFLPGKALTHPDELVFKPKIGIFPDVWVRFSSDS